MGSGESAEFSTDVNKVVVWNILRGGNTMRTFPHGVLAMMLTLGACIIPVIGADDHVMVTPDDLKWEDMPSFPPGVKGTVIEGPLDQATPFIIRFKFPADYQFSPHWHPGIEHITVLSGTLHLGIADKLDVAKTKALPTGSVVIVQPTMPHFGWTKEETVVQVHGIGPFAITYVNPADDPRNK